MKEGDVWEKMYLNENYNPNELEEVRTQRGMSVFKHIENMSRRNSKLNILRSSNISNDGQGIIGAKISSPIMGHRVKQRASSLNRNLVSKHHSGALPERIAIVVEEQPDAEQEMK